MIIINTEHLILRTWKDEDIEPMAAIDQDPLVCKYFPALGNRDETIKGIKSNTEFYNQHGFMFYAVELKATHEMIGFIGLKKPSFESHFTPAIEIGWRLSSRHWNKGYATEGAKAVLDYGFNQLNLDEIVSFTVENNLPSRRVMEKIGMHHDPADDFDHPRLSHDSPLRRHVLYRLSKNEYSNYLQGGRENQILQIGNTIHRPAGAWTKQVHEFLRHLRQKGFYSAPEPLGFDDKGREIVSYIKGEVSNYPLSAPASSVTALISAAQLLREFHDASQSFLTNNRSEQESWQLPAREPQEVICHGDYAPYNVVLDKETAIGIIDFDTAHPGPRLWDLAYALYRWSPFTNPNNNDGFGTIETQITRARLFCQSYRLSNEDRPKLAELMIERLQTLVDLMISQAKTGNKTFERNLQDRHHLLYLADIDYMKEHLKTIKDGLFDLKTHL